MTLPSTIPLWINEVLDSYIEDKKCKELEEQLRISPTAIPNFTLVNGILQYKGKIFIGSTTDVRKKLLESFHNSALGGHLGERVTYSKLKSLFYYHGMKGDTSEYVKSCSIH
jgi:hypothetical protein